VYRTEAIPVAQQFQGSVGKKTIYRHSEMSLYYASGISKVILETVKHLG